MSKQWKSPVVFFLALGMLIAFPKMEWVKSGASETDFMKDRATCEMQSRPVVGSMGVSGTIGRSRAFADFMRGLGYKREKQKK
jgi:hypothetical protein